jgi:N-methylhydantoinase B
MGLRRSVRPVGHTCEFNGVGERFRLAPWGIFGGEPGLRGRFQLHNADGALSELPPKTGRMELGPDQAVIVETPGAGGYGPARERSPADVERDRRSGKFTTVYLRRHYTGG